MNADFSSVLNLTIKDVEEQLGATEAQLRTMDMVSQPALPLREWPPAAAASAPAVAIVLAWIMFVAPAWLPPKEAAEAATPLAFFRCCLPPLRRHCLLPAAKALMCCWLPLP
jgi:hypothetical protein